MERGWWQIFISSLVSKIGLALLILMIVISGYVLATYPLDYGVKVWSNPKMWADNPLTVPPTWVDYFSGRDMVTHHISVTYHPDKTVVISGLKYRVYEVEYDLREDGFPTYLLLKMYNLTMHTQQGDYFLISIVRPDDTEVMLMNFYEAPPPNAEFPVNLYSQNEKILFLSKDKTVGFNLLRFVNEEYKLNYTVDDLNVIGYDKVLFGIPKEVDGKVVWEPYKGKYLVRVYMWGDDRDTLEKVKVVFGGETYGVLGTDANGRDLAQGLLFGFPVALAIGFLTSVVTTFIGASLGIISGYKGGRIDEIIQRISDIVYNFPFLPLLILIVFIISRIPDFPRLLAIIGAIIALGWAGLTILIRSMVLSIRQAQFVEAAKAIGASDIRIMFKHIFPNLAPFIFAQMIFFTPSAILSEAALSFLGLGDPNIPTWGQIIEQAFYAGAVLNGWWWWVLPPGFLIMLAAITFVFIALGLEPVVNPKLQER